MGSQASCKSPKKEDLLRGEGWGGESRNCFSNQDDSAKEGLRKEGKKVQAAFNEKVWPSLSLHRKCKKRMSTRGGDGIVFGKGVSADHLQRSFRGAAGEGGVGHRWCEADINGFFVGEDWQGRLESSERKADLRVWSPISNT